MSNLFVGLCLFLALAILIRMSYHLHLENKSLKLGIKIHKQIKAAKSDNDFWEIKRSLDAWDLTCPKQQRTYYVSMVDYYQAAYECVIWKEYISMHELQKRERD